MGAWSRWVERVGRREDATSLALFRISMGVGVLLTVGSTVWSGLVPVLWIDRDYGGMRSLQDATWLVEALGGAHPTVIWSLVTGALLGGALLTLGVGGRAVALLTLLCTAAVVDVNGHAGGSYDQLLTAGLWLCALGRGGATLSVAARLRTGRWWPEAEVVAFPRWLAAFQLVLMYSMTGLQKVSAHWVPGGEASALYYIMQQPSWQRADMSWVAWVYPLSQVATTVTWFWEVFSPLWLLALWWAVRPQERGRLASGANRIGVRWIFLGVGVMVHLTIFATMEVGPFSYLSLAYYVVMVHPWEWRALARRLRA